MRHGLALLLSAVALVSSAGCVGQAPAFTFGGGSAHNWSAPAPVPEPGRYRGVDVSFTPSIEPLTPTLGLHHCFDGSVGLAEERLTFPYVTYDFGLAAMVSVQGPNRRLSWWPVFKPIISRYHWSASPEETGLLTGLRVGAAGLVGVPELAFLLTFEYGWLTLHDTVGDHDTRLQTATLALTVVLPFFD